MDFISQYLIARSGTMVPARFIRWSALYLLGTTLGRKVYVDWGHYFLLPGVYICLVGTSASRKSQAKDDARSMFLEVFDGYPVGSSITSREDITRLMCSDYCLKTFTDHNGVSVEYRPLANFVNEFSNFMSFDPGAMVEFLTDIFDQKFYSSGTIKRNQEYVLHPWLTILACTTPDKLIGYMKHEIMGGGFARRIVFVYETNLPPRDFAHKSKEAYVAESWCKQHLLKVDKLAGPFTWGPGAYEFLRQWYKKLPRSDDPVLSGYYEAKDGLVQKVAMCLAAAQEQPELVFTIDNLKLAIAFLESNEDNLPRLTVAVGQNILSVPTARLLQLLHDRGGMLTERQFHKLATGDMNEMQYASVKKMLKETGQMFEHVLDYKNSRHNMVLSPDKWIEFTKNGGIDVKN